MASKVLSLEEALASDEAMGAVISQLADENLFLWLDTRQGDVLVDHRPLDFWEDHRYMIDIYSLIDTSLRNQEIVVRKAAQQGGTVWELLGCLFLASRMQPVKVGFYFPTGNDLDKLVKDRLNPMMSSIPEITMRDDPKSKEENLQIKFIGQSSLYLNSVAGKAAKDSIPLDIIFIDEQRLMRQEDVEQVDVRVDHSKIKIKVKSSTPNYPNANIDMAFNTGTQHRWHIHCNCKCPDCGAPGLCLEDYWPECVVERGHHAYLRCPRCKMFITEPQNGGYYPHNPGSDVWSYGFSQLCSHHTDITELFRFFNTCKDKANFWNQKMGLPFIDEANRPISPRVIDACTDPGWQWYKLMSVEQRKAERKKITVMGVDHMSANAYVTILQVDGDEIKLLHLEIIESDNPDYYELNTKTGEHERVSPFNRLYKLMHEFNIDLAMIDGNPNLNEAQAFAQHFYGLVFLAFHNSDQRNTDIVQWLDKAKHKAGTRKSSAKVKFKYKAIVNQYNAVDFMFHHFVSKRMRLPALENLNQRAFNNESSRYDTVCVGRVYMQHLMGLVRHMHITNEKTGAFRMEWRIISEDPHFCFATTYALLVADRANVNYSSFVV